MLEREKRSAIISLSSLASIMEIHGSVGYCSSKLYDDFISRALSWENDKKIDILSVRPYFVSTPLTRNVSTVLHIDKNQCAKHSLRSLGYEKYTYGHWWHNLQARIT